MPEVDSGSAAPIARYSRIARCFHWVVAVLVLILIPWGLAMAYRGGTLNIWDRLTDVLYSTHKLAGLLVLALMLGRLAYRLVHGVPPDEPGLAGWQRAAAHVVHWLLYGLLILVPILGWLGVSLYPSLTIFGRFDLPALAAPDQGAAERVLSAHGWLAIFAGLLVAIHIAAALRHHLVRRDGVLRRMLPPR